MGKMNGVCQRLGGEGNTKLLFNVYFYKMKSILEIGWWGWLHNNFKCT